MNWVTVYINTSTNIGPVFFVWRAVCAGRADWRTAGRAAWREALPRRGRGWRSALGCLSPRRPYQSNRKSKAGSRQQL